MRAFTVLILIALTCGGGAVGSVIRCWQIGQRSEAYNAYVWLGLGCVLAVIAIILAIIAFFVR